MSANVDDAARDLIEQHGTKAAHIALERLNQSIDQVDLFGRDFWAQVVHAIHEHQRAMDAKVRSGRRSAQKRRERPTQEGPSLLGLPATTNIAAKVRRSF